ncbi:MAG: CDP-alcohol phosphatidyltransferase family protein [Oscillospiraceae bacterium]|nr:CDP-alcohol phosphatidyltransferase family protein [Oscillospiraceae bacterium]
MKKQIPNIISASRIPLAISLVFVTNRFVFFFPIYAYCGIMDLVDGFIARRYHLESKLGEKLDNAGDTCLVLAIVAAIFVVPRIRPDINPWIKEDMSENFRRVIILVIIAAGIKVINLTIMKIKFNQINGVHTLMNKSIGIPLVLAVPICLYLQRIPKGLLEIVCSIIIIAIFEETLILIRQKEFSANTKSVFLMKGERGSCAKRNIESEDNPGGGTTQKTRQPSKRQ